MLQRRFNMLPSSVHVIGVGGTGSRVVGPLAQMIASHPILREFTKMYLYDGDEVEEKNLARQNFGPRDVGQNKATVLAKRYSRAYNVPVVGVNKMFPFSHDSFGSCVQKVLGDAQLETSDFDPDGVRVVILGVDSLTARLEVINRLVEDEHRRYSHHIERDGCNSSNFASGTVIIDAGNENTFGQVRIFEPFILRSNMNSKGERIGRESGYEGNIPLHCPVPVPYLDYLNGCKSKPEADASCADLDQTLAINNQMACGIVTLFQNLVLNHPIKFHTWYYDLHNGNSQAAMTPDWLMDSALLNRKVEEGRNVAQQSLVGYNAEVHDHVDPHAVRRFAELWSRRTNRNLLTTHVDKTEDMTNSGEIKKLDDDAAKALAAAFAN